jgi:hypothetical protein
VVVNLVNLETNIYNKDPKNFLHVCVMYIRYMNVVHTTEKSDYLYVPGVQVK